MGKKTTDGGIWPLIENLFEAELREHFHGDSIISKILDSDMESVIGETTDRVEIRREKYQGDVMRQPKYMMGEEVIVTLEMTHNPSGLSRAFDASGIVTSIGYDPKDKTTGAPFYRYGILLDDSSKGIHVNEYDIKEK